MAPSRTQATLRRDARTSEMQTGRMSAMARLQRGSRVSTLPLLAPHHSQRISHPPPPGAQARARAAAPHRRPFRTSRRKLLSTNRLAEEGGRGEGGGNATGAQRCAWASPAQRPPKTAGRSRPRVACREARIGRTGRIV
eukprot:362866-Chlamydomonas_euryale.AAC.27